MNPRTPPFSQPVQAMPQSTPLQLPPSASHSPQTIQNPWRPHLLQSLSSFLRFLLWIGLVTNMAMFCIFSIFFTYRFLTRLWEFCVRTIFSEPW
jgi:hypothetical protein